MLIWKTGEWRELRGLPPADRGFLLGDGLFETLACVEGRVRRLDLHLARLTRSCRAFGLSLEAFDLGAALPLLTQSAGTDRLALRLSMSVGEGARGLLRPDPVTPVILLDASPLTPAPERVSLGLVDIRREASSMTTQHKTLSYVDNVMARQAARAQGFDMGLMLDARGRVSCADCASLIWSAGGQLKTPSLACAALPGTSRAHLLDTFEIEEVTADLSELERADAVFITNALMGVVPVERVGAVSIGGDEALHRRLQQALA
ncbi:MAG: aminotransferase class IV [Maricaulis sp.]|uniref:aminotransferase class IV n=1 Tax=Maricaulis sp. TaxID=1486257 RepID=UPI001B1E3BC0|nr:aminotransferase class IV [Maricaulis sp.]MBO6730957.1 aminotransferase class IV [Maricaulis sp.]MBO6845899.1 aminotransferase class IV [Maricaulis sp.]MBO6876225.1 aminotransferase class IV [Maricaulis sp.]